MLLKRRKGGRKGGQRSIQRARGKKEREDMTGKRQTEWQVLQSERQQNEKT
jgi:hypothetical protein